MATAWVAVLLLWSTISNRMGKSNLTAPLVFVLLGIAVEASGWLDINAERSSMQLIAELTLVVVLFHDASTVRLRALRRDWTLATRLLVIAFPLTVLLIAGLSYWLLPAGAVALAFLVAGATAPTDAGLGAATMLDRRVPVRVRRALNVESGLNDGLATPIVLASIAAISAAEGLTTSESSGLVVTGLAVPIGLGVGVGVGAAAAWLTDHSRRTHWSNVRGRSIAVLLVPFLAFGTAEILEANAFVAAFVSGLVFGTMARETAEEPEATIVAEDAADLMANAVWFLAGLYGFRVLTEGMHWRWILLALLILTVARMAPTWLATRGMGLRMPTVLFLGWSGPRGLATLVFALLALETVPVETPGMLDAIGVMSTTVFISVLAHGVSAGPLARIYGNWATRVHAPIEMSTAPEPMPSRGRPTRPAVAGEQSADQVATPAADDERG